MKAGEGIASVITWMINKIFNIFNKSSENTPVLPAYQWRNNWKKSIWLFYLAEIIGMSMALKYFKDTHAKEAFRIFYIATGSRIMISG